MARLDPHSYHDSAQPQVAHLAWNAKVDFGARRLDCEARLTFRSPGSGPLDLDTRDLEILQVLDSSGQSIAHRLHPSEPILGSRLSLELPPRTSGVRIAYRTSPEASALQWLDPAQTAGGRQPFLFSQCQAIHARSVVPLQDTPRVRLRYSAELTVPRGLRALMAAGFVKRVEEAQGAVEDFEMPQPIPPYLFALAVGELESRELGPRSRVWAEPSVVERAAFEFAGVDGMLRTAEALFGPYPWDRFDLLTMPPSFPYGGMENPRLAFLTPTLLAGDRSLVSVVAHELAHSWTGNLVTNADAEHFWLNEGWTVFAERRILEALEGGEVAALHQALGRRQLERAVERFRDRPELTHLRTCLIGIDPDDAYSEVPYEKGYLFLRALEEDVGRAAFDRFLRRYVEAFAFRSITTEEFTSFAEAELPGALARVGAARWLSSAGIPENAPAPASSRLEALEGLGAALPSEELAGSWTPTEWSLYLESLPRPQPKGVCEELDRRFDLTNRGNNEVLVAWLALAAESGFAPALPKIEQVLGQVGRMKYLKPLYSALAGAQSTRPLARRCFERNKAGYHPIGRAAVESILKRAGA
jgi:leukotriene-A4 hydrolase